jgi:WD-40 repeat-containing protein
VVDGTVYVGSREGTLYAVDAETGSQEWAFTQPSGQVNSSPTVVDETVYVGSRWDCLRRVKRETLYAVDTETGDQEWTFTQPSGQVDSSPTVVDGTVYFGSYETLYAVDAATGSQEWAFTQPPDRVFSSPTVVDGTVYVGSGHPFSPRDGALYAVDAATGSQEWAFTQPSGEVKSSPTVADGTVYVGSHDETLYAVDAETGSQEWAFTQPSSNVYSSPTAVDGTVYVGSRDETLYAVDAATGSQEWAFTQPSSNVCSSPTVVDDPENGDSIGSRVNLGTLGHHHVWAGEDPPDPLDQKVNLKLALAEDLDSWSVALDEYTEVEPLLNNIVSAVDSGDLDQATAEEAVTRLLYGEQATAHVLQLTGPAQKPDPAPEFDLTKEIVRVLFDVGVSIALSAIAVKKRLAQHLNVVDPGAIDHLDPEDVDKLLTIIDSIDFTATMQAIANLMLPEDKAQEIITEFESIAGDIVGEIDDDVLETGEEIKAAIEDAYDGVLETFALPLRDKLETGGNPLPFIEQPGLDDHLDELHGAFTVNGIQSGLQGDLAGAQQGLNEGKNDIQNRAESIEGWITGLDEAADYFTLLGNIPVVLNWIAELGQDTEGQQVSPDLAVSAVITAVVTIETKLQLIGIAIQGAGAVVGGYGLFRMQLRHGITVDAVVEGDPDQYIPPLNDNHRTASADSLDWQGRDEV